MTEPKVFLMCEVTGAGMSRMRRRQRGLRKLAGETRVLVYPISVKTQRKHVERLRVFGKPIVLVHDNALAEDRPSRSEPMRVRVRGVRQAILDMTEDLGVDYYIEAHTEAAVSKLDVPMRYVIRDARTGALRRRSRLFDSVEDMHKDMVHVVRAMNKERI